MRKNKTGNKNVTLGVLNIVGATGAGVLCSLLVVNAVYALKKK